MNMGAQIALLGLGYTFARVAALQVLAIVTAIVMSGSILLPFRLSLYSRYLRHVSGAFISHALIIGRISRLLQPDLPAR